MHSHCTHRSMLRLCHSTVLVGVVEFLDGLVKGSLDSIGTATGASFEWSTCIHSTHE